MLKSSDPSLSHGVLPDTSQGRIARTRKCGDIAAAVVPLYVTSICSETCTYCNFRRANHQLQVVRRRLSPSELEREVELLVHKKGYRAVELVYAGDPGVFVSDMACHVRLLRGVLEQVGGGVVGLNALPLGEVDYRVLVEAGLDFIVLWQETYNRRLHETYHAGSRVKVDYDYRYSAYARMLRAGVRHIGMGVLSGLAPWREDWAALIQHEEELYQEFGVRLRFSACPDSSPPLALL